MITSFRSLITQAQKQKKKRCVVMIAEDRSVLEGVKRAEELGIIAPILVGNEKEIEKRGREVDLDISRCTVLHTDHEEDGIQRSIVEVKEKGDFLMKGMLSTTGFLKGILNKEWGLRTGRILSHIAVLEVPGYHKLLFMSDGGMNPKLNLNVRVDIIENAVKTLEAIGIAHPKIACVAASETVNPEMPETTDAVKIVEMNKQGAITGCSIEGPFGFDVAISKEAALHKKIESSVAGDVDFLLMPNISAANIWAKGLIFFAGAQAAGMVAGAARPVIMLSRADTPETKLNSIALGVIISAGMSS
jgi:phosphate butyryltransferase